MPLIVRFSDVTGLDSEESATARDVGAAEFLSLASEVWRIFEPEFVGRELTVFDTFPGEHLGGKAIARVQLPKESGFRVLRRLEPRDQLSPSSEYPRVHSNNSIEVVGTLDLEGMPTMMGLLQINLYRAWAVGSKDWPGAGDFVLDVSKTARSPFDGLWDAHRARPSAMLPYLERWVKGIAEVSHSRGGRHRIQWAALRETGDASGVPLTGAPMVYRSRTYGRQSLVAAGLKKAAMEELVGTLTERSDASRHREVADAISAEVQSMAAARAFPGVADAFQAETLFSYHAGGSEAFVFRDPDGPERAARQIVHAVRDRLRQRVMVRLDESRLWDDALGGLAPGRVRQTKGGVTLDNFRQSP